MGVAVVEKAIFHRIETRNALLYHLDWFKQ